MYDTDWVQEMLKKRTSEEQVIYYPNCCLTYHPTPYHEKLDRRIKEK